MTASPQERSRPGPAVLLASAAKPRPRKAQPMPDALPPPHKPRAPRSEMREPGDQPEWPHNQDDRTGKEQFPAMDLQDAAFIPHP